MDSPVIRVWPFKDAPTGFKLLSGHGGDEDWVAHVPEVWKDSYIGWAQEGGPFGCCSVSQHALPDGSIVLIGAHA